MEGAFCWLQEEVVLVHPIKDVVYFLGVFFKCSICCHKDVVHIDSVVSRVYFSMECVVHELLEHCRGVAKSEEHHFRFEESSLCLEGSLPLVFFFDWSIVVTPSYIEL